MTVSTIGYGDLAPPMVYAVLGIGSFVMFAGKLVTLRMDQRRQKERKSTQ